VALLGASGAYFLREDEPSYGYHHCPLGSVCFFSEQNGNGDICSWKGDDTDWLVGKETCAWTRDRPVKSVFVNVPDDGRAPGGVKYFRGRDFTPMGIDRTRHSRRTGCIAVRQQGNLAGTYAPLSHRWIDHR
jgi:hypothetical protein